MGKQQPLSFEKLMGMLLEEYSADGTIFGVKNFYKAGRQRLPIFGMRIENPVGPAAGPSTQTAMGIIAAYAAGARFIELKTVCTEASEIRGAYVSCGEESFAAEKPSGFSLAEAFGEYVRAWYAIKLLSTSFEFGVPEGFIFNMSVGGGLAELKTDGMNAFIEGLKSAEYTSAWRECENWARAHMDEFDGIDGTYISDISPKICNSVTFVPDKNSSAAEIEAAARYLIEEKRLHTFVRLDPNLLGYYNIKGILDINGYYDLEPDMGETEGEALYDELKPALLRLQSAADSLRLEFGVKVCGGLALKAGSEIEGGKLTGRALMPIAFSLAEKIANDFGGGLRICYSGGADALVAAKFFDAGVWPVTMASELLRPGGLERLYQTASAVSKCDYAQFSGIITSDLPDIEKTLYESGKYRTEAAKKPKKAKGAPPAINCAIAQCRAACPLGQDVPYILRLIKKGRSLEALRVIFERNPLPFITGKLCPHPCMDSCSRRFYECPINIINEKYKTAQNACFDLLDETQVCSRAGEPVAIVGCGAAGMACACFLAKQGAAVTVFDREQRPGGAITKYVPKERAADSDIEWDATLVQALGIEMELETEVNSVKELRKKGFEKVILAVGAGEKKLKLAFGKSVSAFEILERARRGDERLEEEIMGNVAVIGGGAAAVSAARFVKKLPSVDRVNLVFERPENEMTAAAEEIAAMKKEGIFVSCDTLPTGLRGGNLFCKKMTLGEFDEKTGETSIVETGEKEKLPADIVINAAGGLCESPLMEELDAKVWLAGSANIGGEANVAEIIADCQRLCAKIANCHFDRYVPDNESDDKSFMESRGKLCADCKKCAESDRCLECETVCEFCAEACPGRAMLPVTLSDGTRQILHIDEFCDGCGACASCCPYEGAPDKNKFTLFLNEESFAKSACDGFFVTGEANNCRIRFEGKAFKYDPINGPLGMIPDELRELCGTVMKTYPRLLKSE